MIGYWANYSKRLDRLLKEAKHDRLDAMAEKERADGNLALVEKRIRRLEKLIADSAESLQVSVASPSSAEPTPAARRTGSVTWLPAGLKRLARLRPARSR